MQIALHTLDYFLHILHISAIVINCTFWWSRRTLLWAQIFLAITMLSWLGMGPIYGWGYCFLTDWQWQVKESLGEVNLPYSYITYMVRKLGYQDVSPQRIDIVVAIVLFFSVLGCLLQTVRFRKRKS